MVAEPYPSVPARYRCRFTRDCIHIEDAEEAENFELIDVWVSGDWLRRSNMVSAPPTAGVAGMPKL